MRRRVGSASAAIASIRARVTHPLRNSQVTHRRTAVGSRDVVDLRSDTATNPTREMRAAMANAQVGDEQRREDPTVNELQRRCAALLGQEAALFVPTATMANQIALRVLGRPGGVLVAEERTHVLIFEAGGPAVHSGLVMRGIPGVAGRIAPEQLRALAAEADDLQPASVVVLENTHRSAGGRVWPLEELREVAAAAREAGMGVHLDGAEAHERVGRERRARRGLRTPRRLGDPLLLEGPRLPARRRHRDLRGADRGGLARQVPVWRSHAPGGHRRGGGPPCARPPRRRARRGPPARARSRGGAGRRRAGCRPGRDGDELRRRRRAPLGLDTREAARRIGEEGVLVSPFGRACCGS